MLKKHSILLGISVALALLFVATMVYPGGSQNNKNSVGFSWRHNYLSNLFNPKAVNGASNPAQWWAVGGMLFLTAGFAVFFIQFSQKIPVKRPANIIKFCGVGGMAFAFLAITPLHNQMITVAVTLALVSMFYITIFVFTSKMLLLKMLCVVCLLVVYCCNYIYYTRSYLDILPIVQKVAIFTTVIWVLCLHYFTTGNHFPQKNKSQH